MENPFEHYPLLTEAHSSSSSLWQSAALFLLGLVVAGIVLLLWWNMREPEDSSKVPIHKIVPPPSRHPPSMGPPSAHEEDAANADPQFTTLEQLMKAQNE